MKNVIVFALGGARYAVELRWVREVITLGYVTPVPTAPPEIAGVVNLRGALTPVMDLLAFPGYGAADDAAADGDDDASARRPRIGEGDGAIVIEADGVTAALRIDKVDEVSTLSASRTPDTVVDADDRDVPVIDPPELFRVTMIAANGTAELPPLPESGRAPF